jgi:VanZ family protein
MRAAKVVLSIISVTLGSKTSFVMVSLVVVVSVVDSEFINLFYATDLGTPGNIQLSLFISFAIVASIITITFLRLVKGINVQPRANSPSFFKVAYSVTAAIQCSLLVILVAVISQTIILHGYSKIFSILVVYLSHFISALILGLLSFIFVQWFRSSRSFSILTYAVVFIAILFTVLVTVPLLTEQFELQPQWIYPRDYIALITDELVPSPDIAFIYGLGTYALPMLVFATWILTVSLLRGYSTRTGKKKFWLIISIPLIFQIFSLVVTNTNIITDPSIVEFIYSTQFHFILGISYQIYGIIFAIAFLIIGRKIKLERMKNYLTISALGIILLFSSLQPGSPFYAAYPPFGLVTLLFLGLASYMLFAGFVGSAAYVSRDNEVRREVYRSLEEDSHILKMGVAEMQREIEKKVVSLSNKIKSSELQDEMKVEIEPNEEDEQTMIDGFIHTPTPFNKNADVEIIYKDDNNSTISNSGSTNDVKNIIEQNEKEPSTHIEPSEPSAITRPDPISSKAYWNKNSGVWHCRTKNCRYRGDKWDMEKHFHHPKRGGAN